MKKAQKLVRDHVTKLVNNLYSYAVGISNEVMKTDKAVNLSVLKECYKIIMDNQPTSDDTKELVKIIDLHLKMLVTPCEQYCKDYHTNNIPLIVFDELKKNIIESL
jgi:hypothetical protein